MSEELEVRCVGPVTSAILQAMERGIRVRAWTLAEGGIVALRVPACYESPVEGWYRQSAGRRPGDCLSFSRVLEP